MATIEQIEKLALNWSLHIQQYMETVHSTRLDTVPPKGDLTSVETLLMNWGQAIPNTYTMPTEQQLLDALALVEANISAQDAIDIVEDGAEAQILAIPNFARWTEAQFLAWIDANISDTQIDVITNLAEARVVMKRQTVAFTAVMRLLVGLRNKVLPHLEGS